MLILSVCYAIFSIGKYLGFNDGQIQGYMQGYDSFYQHLYYDLKNKCEE